MISTKMPFGRAILEPALMSQLGHSRRFKREVGTTVSPNARLRFCSGYATAPAPAPNAGAGRS